MKKCKFCGNTSEKLVDSHIIPKAFFIYTKRISDRIGWSGNMLMITNTNGQQPRRRLMIGWYDQNLVCKDCEEKFKEYDNYAIRLLLKQEKYQKLLILNGQTMGWLIESFDYKKLKLFFISLLWRAGASDLPQFKRINIRKHLQRARDLILSDNPGNENEFSFILARFGDIAGKAFMLDPHPESKNDAFGDILCYRFYLGGGYIAYVKVDKRPFPSQSIDIAAKDGKSLVILRRTDFPVSVEWKAFKVVYQQADEELAKLKELRIKHS